MDRKPWYELPPLRVEMPEELTRIPSGPGVISKIAELACYTVFGASAFICATMIPMLLSDAIVYGKYRILIIWVAILTLGLGFLK